ncbi:MAG: phospholipid carrier-dependent glycosyltransferase, partial [Actinobacteria bacterium]|nr:phospholipid carrier-dependent glycosyltransferase [Actinomycetota bacterium]
AIASFFLRVINLGNPKGFVFDEVYYVDGARDFLKYGVEVAGSNPEFVVHPPVGKWCISLGIKIFGDNEFGWRIMAAIAGTLIILIAARLAHELFFSPFLTAITAALLAFDGLLLVHSRTALLDLFLTLFILIAVYFWFREQNWHASIFFGLALATKWSALYFIFLLAVVSLYRLLRENRVTNSIRTIAMQITQFGLIPLGIYLATWFGWFASNRGWDRTYASNPLSSLIYYHKQMLDFHTSLVEKHAYQANPWGWLIMRRPTSFYYESPTGCGSKSCAQEVLALGTPVLWWSATIALVALIGLWAWQFYHRNIDKKLSLILLSVVAGYLPWFFFQKRTVFSFYAIVFEPFLILAVVYCAKLFIDRSKNPANAQVIIIGFVAVVFLNFLYFLPLYLGEVITYAQWHMRMWFTSWI